jgi:uncharacterized protein (DUF2062 family)
MLFRRRKRKSFIAHARNFIWPSMGWRRTYEYIKHRILRLPASNYSIAMGLSMGCIVSWTPLFGFHILQCFLLCLITRANFLAGLLGTVFGNPWTFPVLLWASYKAGSYALIFFGYGDNIILDADMSIMEEFSDKPMKVFLPTLVGGYIMAVITAPLFYILFFYMVKTGRLAQRKISDKVHDIVDHRRDKK